MFWMNKAVGFVINPFMIGMLLFFAAFFLRLLQRRKSVGARSVKLSMACGVFAFVWLWFWGCNVTIRLLGLPLEKSYPPQEAKTLPTADAIIVLGGGMGASNGMCIYPEMRIGADRAWHGARLYHADRAQYVVTTGTGSGNADRVLLLDLGVPEKAIIREDVARNTEEHVRLVKEALQKKYPQKKGKFKVLIVTSAWHMRRALLNFEQSDFEAIPAAADHECMLAASRPLKLSHFFPDAESFLLNSYIFKEHLGYWLYRVKFAVKPRTK